MLDGHERHELAAAADLRVLCVFTPALVGTEAARRRRRLPPATAG